MKTMKFTLLLVIAMLLLVPSAFAAGPLANGQAAADVAVAADPSADQSAAGADSGVVPQAQVERVKKREALNKRRAALLKLRQQLIETDNPGNLDGQQPVQSIQ